MYVISYSLKGSVFTDLQPVRFSALLHICPEVSGTLVPLANTVLTRYGTGFPGTVSVSLFHIGMLVHPGRAFREQCHFSTFACCSCNTLHQPKGFLICKRAIDQYLGTNVSFHMTGTTLPCSFRFTYHGPNTM
jgi:hypothetical protein